MKKVFFIIVLIAVVFLVGCTDSTTTTTVAQATTTTTQKVVIVTPTVTEPTTTTTAAQQTTTTKLTVPETVTTKKLTTTTTRERSISDRFPGYDPEAIKVATRVSVPTDFPKEVTYIEVWHMSDGRCDIQVNLLGSEIYNLNSTDSGLLVEPFYEETGTESKAAELQAFFERHLN